MFFFFFKLAFLNVVTTAAIFNFRNQHTILDLNFRTRTVAYHFSRKNQPLRAIFGHTNRFSQNRLKMQNNALNLKMHSNFEFIFDQKHVP